MRSIPHLLAGVALCAQVHVCACLPDLPPQLRWGLPLEFPPLCAAHGAGELLSQGANLVVGPYPGTVKHK